MDVDDKITTQRANWSFGGDVAESFVTHARKSIPGYDEGHALICDLSDFFCANDSLCYELGCSTGQLLHRLAVHSRHKPNIRWIGIDSEMPMVNFARKHCSDMPNIEVMCDDIASMDFEKTDLVVAYYTVQFVRPRNRQTLINRVFQALNWGGAFIMFEKVRGPDARFQDIATSLYVTFKRRNDFTAEQILNKTDSLKSVLEPFSTQGNIDLLKRAGFQDITTVYKNICFEGFLAIK